MSKNVVDPTRLQVMVRRRVTCWIRKATRAQAGARAPTSTHTHKYVILLFRCNNGYVNAPRRYVTRILPLLSGLYTHPQTTDRHCAS